MSALIRIKAAIYFLRSLATISVAQLHSATVKVIKDGRVTIPQEIRDVEGIREGDYIRITIEKIEKRQ